MRKARGLYAGEDLGLELENTVYALDSTTIDLSLTLFPWAGFRRAKAGIKMHTQIDLRGPIPTCIYVTAARQHDVLWLDQLLFEAGAFYVMDRGYMDFKRLHRIAAAGAFFVTRAKDNLRFSRQRSLPVDHSCGLRSDQIGKPTLPKARQAFPGLLRKVRYFDAGTGRDFVFLTNHLQIPALSVAQIYRLRWRIELFFRWIKGHLRIKHYFGTSPNAVKTQIWIAVAVYLMVAIIHKELKLPGTLPCSWSPVRRHVRPETRAERVSRADGVYHHQGPRYRDSQNERGSGRHGITKTTCATTHYFATPSKGNRSIDRLAGAPISIFILAMPSPFVFRRRKPVAAK